ncbi:tape measure domain-containing protein [Prevotella sp. HUN102]|uniref:tape measure protein n=1 Tax=Prevotella sp. HUN102 TaxID=1392486 RepID=UPI000566BA5D|nr:tape measure domain-containing protein [Prevotella sp. HUN102]
MPQLSFRINAEWEKVQKLRDEIAKLKQEIKGTDAIQNPTAFNNLNNKLQQTSKELGNVTGRIAQASATMETDFKQKIFAASQGVNDFTEKIIAQKAVVKDVAADVKRLGEAYRDAKKYSPMSADGKLAEWKAAKRALEEEKAALFSLTQEQATARLFVKRLNDEYKAFRQEGGGTAQTMNLLSSKMKGIAATVMGGIGLKELASRIISVRAEFESMETSLKVLLGGSQERLDKIMGQIKEYALASPLNTKDMVGAVQMMTSFGIEAEKSIDYLKAIGDISMGDTGKFNSLALAFSQMSSAGKLMGQDLMQMVNAGFNPLEEISRKTGKSIGELKEEMSKGAITSKMVQDAFISVTSAGGKFYGMASEGAKTLNGQISMLQESFDNMFNEIGSKGEGVVMSAVKAGTYLVENYETVGGIIMGVATVYGVYRAALVANIALEKIQALNRLSSIKHTTLLGTITDILKAKTAALNTTMLASPVFWIAAAIVGVAYASYKLVTSESAKERAVRKTNEAMEEQKKILDERKEKINDLIGIIKDQNSTEYDTLSAYKELKEIAPELTEKYTQQQIAALETSEAQKELNKSMNEIEYKNVQKEIEDLTEKQKELQGTIELYANSKSLTQGDALNMASTANELNEVNAQLDILNGKLGQMDTIRKEIEENNKPYEIKLKEAEGNVEARQHILDFYSEAMTMIEGLQDSNDGINYDNAKAQIDTFVSNAEKELDDLRKEQEKDPLNMSLKLEAMEKQSLLNDILAMKDNLAITGVTTIPLFFSVKYDGAKGLLGKALETLSGVKKNKPLTLQDEYANASKEYLNAKKKLNEIDRNKSAHTSKERKEAEEAVKVAESRFRALGGNIETRNSSRNKSNEKQRKAEQARHKAEQEARERQRQAEEAARKRETLFERNIEAEIKADDDLIRAAEAKEEERIASITDAGERERAEYQLQYDKTIRQIRKQADEMQKAKYEENKKDWDLNNTDKTKVYSDTEEGKKGYKAVKLGENEESYIQAMIGKADREYESQQGKWMEERRDALTAYLKEYGSVQQQRLAIAEEYERKIADARTEGERLSLNAQKMKALSDFDIKNEKDGLNWEEVFGDLGNQTIDRLEEIKARLREMLNSDNLDIEGYKSAVEQIGKVNDAIIEAQDRQNPFFSLTTEHARERRKLEMEAADAIQRQTDAMNSQAAAKTRLFGRQYDARQAIERTGVKYDGDITASNTDAILREVERKYGTDSEQYRNVRKAMEKLAESEIALVSANKKKIKADTDAANAQGKLNKFLDNISKKLQGFIESFEKINANIQEMPNLLSNLGVDGDSAFFKGVEDMANASNDALGAIKDFESGNFVGAAAKGVSAIGNIVNAGLNLFGGGADSDRNLEKDIERLTSSNEALMNSIDALSDEMKKGAVANAQEIYEEQKKRLAQAESNTQEMMERSAGSHKKGFGGKHSSASAIDRDLRGTDYWQQISSLLGKKVGNAGNFFNLTSEEMARVARELPEIYSRIKSLADDGYKDAAQFMDEYIGYHKQLEELETQVLEKLTSSSFDSIVGDFENALLDMESDAESFAESFEGYMRKAVIGALVSNQYKPLIEKWYKAFAGYMESDKKLDPEEIRKLKETGGSYVDKETGKSVDFESWNDIVKMGIDARNAIFGELGLGSGSQSQKATANGVTEITYEQASNIVALTTAGNITRDQIKDIITLTNAKIDDFKAVQMETKNIADELRTIQANSYIELQGIHEDTTAMSKAIKSMSSDVSDIKKQIKDM